MCYICQFHPAVKPANISYSNLVIIFNFGKGFLIFCGFESDYLLGFAMHFDRGGCLSVLATMCSAVCQLCIYSVLIDLKF